LRAAVLERAGAPLVVTDVPVPTPGTGEVLIRVAACGACRTDLHILDGELTESAFPLIPGHQIVGKVEVAGAGAMVGVGQRVGVPWLASTCGHCDYCASERENLCDDAKFTGYTRNGGFAEYAVADARFCVPLPEGVSGASAAPLLCAGLIGYRALRLAGDAKRLGLYGFGASAHIVAQVAAAQGQEVYAFTRAGDIEGQDFARSLGARWAGASEDRPPQQLDAAILFAPVGALVPLALSAVAKGGVVVCAGIHMSDLPSFPYSLLFGERSVRSVSNLTRRDAQEFFELLRSTRVETHVHEFPLERASEALEALRSGQITGAAVLTLNDSC
jgi:propanol-preferring alcohol dehydrogenase